MSHNVTPNTSRVELRKTLTLVPVVMMGLAYMQPMTLFDTFGIVSGLTDGHVPTAYAFALIAILFTALSYGKLVRRYPSAGSAYTYAQKSISPTVGFMVGWSSLLDYLFAPMINILLAKIYFEALVPSIPSWMFVVALVAFMTAFNLRSLKSVANFNTVIVVLQVVLIAVILGMVVYGVFEGEGAGTLASTRPFWSGDAHVIPMITGATILCFSFTGFDGISNLSEETKDAERVIPRAIFLTALIGGMIFIFATYFLQLYFPDISRFKDPDASQPEIMLYVAGKAFQVGALIFSTITVLASGMAAHAGVARLMYVMGRDGVFPKSFFGYVHPKWRTPAMNIILVGAIALLAINFDLVMATALKPILIIPLISSLVVGLAMIYLIGKPVAGILEGLTHWLQTMGTANAVLLGAILGGMMCTDMGGPVNKAAYAFGVGLLSTQTYGPMAAIMAAGMVPPLAMGLATMVARRKFDKAQQEGGKAALVLGLCFISEGAIPFAARDPMRVLPCCIVGGALTGAISMAIGAKLMAPHGGLFVLLIPGAITPVLGYLVAIIAGTLVAGLAYAFLKRPEVDAVAKAA